VYRFSKANQIGQSYQQQVLQHCADPTSWFSLYEIRKTGWPDLNMPHLEPSDKVPDMRFSRCEEAVRYMEQLLARTGYEAVQRRGFQEHATVDPVGMAMDLGYLVSYLVAEHD